MKPGGAIVPSSFAASVAEDVRREFERMGRNVAAEAKARAAREPGYLREGSLGGRYYVEFTAPPSRRERLRRRVREARRRVREAVLLLRTGETSYDEDGLY